MAQLWGAFVAYVAARGSRRIEPYPKAGPRISLGVPFHENVNRHSREKAAIGRAAARLCEKGSAIMIDGGSTTLQMCRHLKGLDLQVLTNSLHIVSALLPQSGTRILVPGGSVFREQNIILSPVGEDAMPRFHSPKLFMGAAALGEHGLMQADIILVAAERRLIERAEEVIVLVDSSKFRGVLRRRRLQPGRDRRRHNGQRHRQEEPRDARSRGGRGRSSRR